MSKRPVRLQGKKILVVGVGVHGGGAAVIRYLLKHRALVKVTDMKLRSQLRNSLSPFKKLPGTFGRHDLKDVAWADLLVKNPGVPKESAVLIYAKRIGKPVVSDLTLFLDERKKKIDVAITGTRGKSTTTALIGHVASKMFRVFVGGNNRNSVLQSKNPAGDFMICELSSWQIEDTDHPKLYPHVGVFTNIYQDHLNRYSSMRAYVSAKAKLFLGQSAQDFAVLNYDQKDIRKFGSKFPAKKLWFSRNPLPAGLSGAYLNGQKCFFQERTKSRFICNRADVKLLGDHNTYNILAAIASLRALKIPATKIAQHLSTFSGLPGRCQRIKILQGVSFFNDTTATSPDALLACATTLHKAFPKATHHMIVGGSTKNLSYSPLRKIQDRQKFRWYFLKGSATKDIAEALKISGKYRVYADLTKAVIDAYRNATQGDTVTLSPGAASFGMFKHEFDRGDVFNRIVRNI